MGQYSNYLSVPGDSPQREERLGWTADTQVFAQTGLYLGDNKNFLRKFMTDMSDAQREDGAIPGTVPIENNGNKLGTGFLGTAIILPALTKIGRSDVAYTLLLQRNNPSWLYSVAQGATTWERWDSYTPEKGFVDASMNSFNHYAYGAVAGWMFSSMVGMGYDSEHAGFKHIIFAPHPDM